MHRFPSVKVTFSNEPVERNPASFFQGFNFVLLAVDTVRAREWVNEMLASLVLWRPTANPGADSSILTAKSFTYQADEAQGPVTFIDVGSEGYQCNAKTIIHGVSECMQCQNRFTESKTVQVCTLESIPRRPEHCVTFVKIKMWEQLKPFGTHYNDKGVEVPVPVDGDNVEHIAWIAQRSQDRLVQFKLPGSIDFTFTQGVVKNSIAAVGFTNATVAAVMVGEMFKLLLEYGKPAKHYGLYGGSTRVFSSRTDLERNPKCKICVPNKHINLSIEANLADAMTALMNHTEFQAISKRRAINRTCDVNLRRYLHEERLFSLRGRGIARQGSGNEMEREDSMSNTAMVRQDSIANASEGSRFFDILHDHQAALIAAINHPDHVNDEAVRIRTKHLKLKDVFGLKNVEDAEITSIYIVVFDDVKFLINWS
eukprot:GILI01031986.1.p1 GENE.GILI01031986.1~~GILI01031986.1.p1  ORF type:complete len:439 (-),score=114.43 GILI01031986.1:73-1350(-)